METPHVPDGAGPPPGTGAVRRTRATRGGEAVRAREVRRFAVTGAVAYVVDVAVFNLVLLGTAGGPVTAKVVSSVAAITTAFVGSRWYTWADRPRHGPVRQYALFLALSVVAAGIQVLVIVIANDLGFTGAVADNISGNVVGMGLATLFRFVTFRRYVFAADPAGGRGRPAGQLRTLHSSWVRRRGPGAGSGRS